MESISTRQLSSLLKPFGIKVIPPWHSKKANAFFEMRTMDGTGQIGLRARTDFAYGSGWKYLKMLVNDICSPHTDAFVLLSTSADAKSNGKQILANPFRGCKTFIEMKVRRDLGAMA